MADLILDAYMVPNFNSGSDFVCWDQYSCAGMFLFLKLSLFPQFSRFDPCTVQAVFARQDRDEVLGGPAKNAHCSVVGSGAFQYLRIACWKLSMSKLPLEPVFPMIRRLIVFTAISARQLLCGYATELRRWWTPQSCRNFWVVWGPPSEDSSIGGKSTPEAVDQTLGSFCCSFHNWPVRVTVN